MNFVMPATTNDYRLDSVALDLEVSATAPVLQIWSDDGSSTPIGNLLETLTNPTTLVNGINIFTSPSGLTLEGGETYWAVLTNPDSTGTPEEIRWLGDTDLSVMSDIGATHTARLFGNPISPGPGGWNSASGVFNRLEVNASRATVPEPASGILFTIVMLVGGIACRRLIRR